MNRETVVVDACAMINLRRGQLLDFLPYLDCQLVIPAEIRLELTRFTRADWSLLDGSGMRTFALPADDTARITQAGTRCLRLSASDHACLAVARHHPGGILLTDDRQLRRVAEETQVPVHGSLWAVDRMAIRACPVERLEEALRTWRDDISVYLPEDEIGKRLKRFRKAGGRPPRTSGQTPPPSPADIPGAEPAGPS